MFSSTLLLNPAAGVIPDKGVGSDITVLGW